MIAASRCKLLPELKILFLNTLSNESLFSLQSPKRKFQFKDETDIFINLFLFRLLWLLTRCQIFLFSISFHCFSYFNLCQLFHIRNAKRFNWDMPLLSSSWMQKILPLFCFSFYHYALTLLFSFFRILSLFLFKLFLICIEYFRLLISLCSFWVTLVLFSTFLHLFICFFETLSLFYCKFSLSFFFYKHILINKENHIFEGDAQSFIFVSRVCFNFLLSGFSFNFCWKNEIWFRVDFELRVDGLKRRLMDERVRRNCCTTLFTLKKKTFKIYKK